MLKKFLATVLLSLGAFSLPAPTQAASPPEGQTHLVQYRDRHDHGWRGYGHGYRHGDGHGWHGDGHGFYGHRYGRGYYGHGWNGRWGGGWGGYYRYPYYNYPYYPYPYYGYPYPYGYPNGGLYFYFGQ